MNPSHGQSNEWEPRNGEYLASIGRNTRASHRRRTIGRGVVGTLIVVGVIVMGVKMVGRSSPPGLEDAREIACAEVQKNLSAFITGNLNAHLSAEIEAHLKMCLNCQAALAKLQASHVGAMPQAPLSRAKLLAVSGNKNLLLAQH